MKLRTQTHDKFANKTTTCTCIIRSEDYYDIRFRHVSTPNLDVIVLDCNITTFADQSLYGEIIIRINNLKNYRLSSHENYNTRPGEEDSVYYDISRELLKEVADASSVELKIIGINIHTIFEPKKSGYQPAIQSLAQALYDTIYNSQEYEQNVHQEIRNIEDFLKKKSMYEINKGKWDSWSERTGIIWGFGSFITLIAGGIWSIGVGNWNPLIWFAVGTIVLGTLCSIKTKKLKYEIEAYESKYGAVCNLPYWSYNIT